VEGESSTFGLHREKLAKLWKMGEDTPNNQEADNAESPKVELLQALLAESLSLDAGITRMLPDIVSVVFEKLKPFTGCSYREILLNPEADPSVLETIKNLHKRRAESASGPAQEVAAIIYYASIAGALVHHDTRITKLSYEGLSQSFENLARSDWLPTNIRQLFDRAHKYCIRRMKQREK